MTKTVTAMVLAISLAASSASAQGREPRMSEQQVANAMVSTAGSLVANPSSGPAGSARASISGVPLVLGLMVIILIAATRSNSYMMSY